MCARPWSRVRVLARVPVRGPVSVSISMPVIVFMERLRVCVRGHVSVTVQVAVDTSHCLCPVPVIWTQFCPDRVPVVDTRPDRVCGQVLW